MLSSRPPGSRVRIEPLGASSTRYIARRCSVVVTRLARGKILLTYEGYNDGEIGDAAYAALDVLCASDGPLVLFMDTRLQSGVVQTERERAAAWARAKGELFRGGHLLFKSKLLELALALGNMLVATHVRGYSDVAMFERSIAEDVPGFVRLPRFSPVTR